MQISADWIKVPKIRNLMAILTEDGTKAYFVGGCVRNSLLRKPITDIDISTNATPEKVMKITKSAGLKALPTGIDHGTVTVIVDGEPFEITTFRKDVSTDGRRAVVKFSDNIMDDAKRRDFTMNALYADADGHVIDPLNGLPDLTARHVRFILDPEQRIAEDYLRILRFFRFHTLYGDIDAGMDADALAACASGAEGIETLSKERIGSEMRKILSAPHPEYVISTMHQIGVLSKILPGSTARYLPVLVHLEKDVPISWIRRLAVLGGEGQAQLLRMSKKEAKTLSTVLKLIETGTNPMKAAYLEGAEIARDAHLVLSVLTEQHPIENLNQFITSGNAARGKFPITATDLPDLNGKELGQHLKQLEELWIESQFQKTRQELLA